MIKISINISFSLFKKKWELWSVKDQSTFIKVSLELLGSLSGIRSKSTLDNYRTALCSFSSYLDRDIPIEVINTDIIEGYERWLINKGITPNTASCYMRSLRSLIHKIKPEADVQQIFKNVFTGKERTEKRSLPIEDIYRLQQLSLSKDTQLAFVRDLFLFSFYALGMPFVDMAYLRKSQITNGYIVYHRHKTGQRICIKIEPPMQQIINHYQVPEGPYVFPILKGGINNYLDAEYETARASYNRHLKQLGKMANTQRTLTSYVARHSWASTAYHSNVSLSVISKALGHTSANTTQNYLQSIDDQSIDDANHLLLRNFKLAGHKKDK